MNIMKENISLMTCNCAGTQLIDEVVTGLILYWGYVTSVSLICFTKESISDNL